MTRRYAVAAVAGRGIATTTPSLNGLAAAGDRGYRRAPRMITSVLLISSSPIEGRLEMRLVRAAMLRLDGKMNQLFVFSKQLAVFIGTFGLMRNDRDDGGELSSSNLPDVQIGYKRIAIPFHGAPNFIRQI